MDQVKINPQTGQVAIPNPDGSWHIYEKGQYKTNSQTGQIAVPDGGGWKLFDGPKTSPTPTTPANPIDQLMTQQLGPQGSGGKPDVSVYGAAGEGLIKGGGMGWADEIGARLAQAGGVPYDESIKYLRGIDAKAAEAHPIAHGVGMFAGSLPSAMAMPNKTLLQAVGSGAAGGGTFMAGASDQPTLAGRAKYAAGGAAFGGLLGATGYGINKAIASNTPEGVAYGAIDQNSKSGIQPLATGINRTGAVPAEFDPLLPDLLKTAAAGNPKAAMEAIPGAQANIAKANAAAIDQIDNLLSPQNGELLKAAIKDAAKGTNSAAYKAAYADPMTVGLLPEDSTRTVMQKALEVANTVAQAEKPPRAIDPTNLNVKDLDIVQRVLGSMVEKAKSITGSVEDKALAPATGESLNNVMEIIKNAAPKLAQAEQGAKAAFKAQDAVDLGGTWFSSNKAADQVASEFAALSPQEQQAALSGFATKFKNVMLNKNVRANPAALFEKIGIADKLAALGFPQASIDEIVRSGNTARGVLNALIGGSDTARKLLAQQSMKSAMSGLQTGDVVAAGVLNNPTVAGILPAMRAIGGSVDKGAAGIVVKALTDPNELVRLSQSAPQAYQQLMQTLLQSLARTGGNRLTPGVQQ